METTVLLAAIIGAAIALIAVYIAFALRGRSGKGSLYSEYFCHRIVRLSIVNDKIQASPELALLQFGGTVRWVLEDAKDGDDVNITFAGGGPFNKRCGYDANPKRGVFQTKRGDIDTDPADTSGRFKYTVRWARSGKEIELDPEIMVRGEDA